MSYSVKSIPNLEKFNACFIIKHEKDFSDIVRPSIFIQAIDSYGVQMEYSLKLTHRFLHETGKTVYYWDSHAYFHPGLRSQVELSEGVAECLFSRLIERVEKYPSLLFNEGSAVRGKNNGIRSFLSSLIHYGMDHSVKTLES